MEHSSFERRVEILEQKVEWLQDLPDRMTGVEERLTAVDARLTADVNAWEVAVRGAPALAASLAEHRADAFLFRQLATLRTDVPLAESLDDLRWRGPDVPALTALAEHWGDDAIVERATRFARR